MLAGRGWGGASREPTSSTPGDPLEFARTGRGSGPRACLTSEARSSRGPRTRVRTGAATGRPREAEAVGCPTAVRGPQRNGREAGGSPVSPVLGSSGLPVSLQALRSQPSTSSTGMPFIQAWSRGQRVKRQGAQRTRWRTTRRRTGRPSGRGPSQGRVASGSVGTEDDGRRRPGGVGQVREARVVPDEEVGQGDDAEHLGERGPARRGRRRARQRRARRRGRSSAPRSRCREGRSGDLALSARWAKRCGEALLRPALGLVGEGGDVGRREGTVGNSRVRQLRARRAAESFGDGPGGVGYRRAEGRPSRRRDGGGGRARAHPAAS